MRLIEKLLSGHLSIYKKMIRVIPILLFFSCSFAFAQSGSPSEKEDKKIPVNPGTYQSKESALKVNLLDALTLALSNSPDTKRSLAIVRQRAALVRLGYTKYFPTLTAEIDQNKIGKTVDYDTAPYANYSLRTRSSNVVLSLNWILYDSGLRNADIEYAEHMLVSAEDDKASASRDIIVATIEAFYKLQYSTDLVESLRASEIIARASSNSIQRLFKAGTVPVTDKLLAETTADQAAIRRAQAESDKRLALIEFNGLIGMPRETVIEVDDRSQAFMGSAFTEDTRQLVDRMLQEHPLIRSGREKVRAAEAKIATARTENSTTISFTGSSYRSRTPPAESVTAQSVGGWSVGLALKIPLFDGFSSSKKVEAAVAEKVASQADLDKSLRDLESQIYKNRELLDKETEHIQLLNSQLEKVQLTCRAVTARYASGVGTVVELLKGQTDLADTEQQRIKAISDWHLAQLRLAALLGMLDSPLLHQD
ncbi:TolC family protein [Herbaspirillum rubrisubalbicans]|nr:TolC family protein [Herbaspirillum rubrisubalbicans]